MSIASNGNAYMKRTTLKQNSINNMKTLKLQKLLKSLVLGLLLVSPCTHADNNDRIKTIKQQVMMPAVKPMTGSHLTLPYFMNATNDRRLTPMKAEGTDIVVLSEDFSRFTSGSEDAPDMSTVITNNGNVIPDYTNTGGWYGTDIYQAGGCCFLATGYQSSIMTPFIDLSADNGNFNVEFSCRAQSGQAIVNIYSQTMYGYPERRFASCNETWQTITIPFRELGGRESTIQIYADVPIFIDNIRITQKDNPEISRPAVMDATNVTDTEFTANWIAVNKATSYLLDVFYFSDNQPQYVLQDYNILDTKLTVKGLQPGRIYYYSVQATDGVHTSAESNIVAAINPVTDMEPPVATEATEVSKDGFRANWTSVENATQYELCVRSEYTIPQSGTFVLADEHFDDINVGTIENPIYIHNDYRFDQYTEYPDWIGLYCFLADGMIGLSSYYQTPEYNMSTIMTPYYKVSTANPGKIKINLSAMAVDCSPGTRLQVILYDVDPVTEYITANSVQYVEINEEMTSYELELGESNYYTIYISFMEPEGEQGVFDMVFVDDIKITQEMEAGTVLTRTYNHYITYNNGIYVETPDSPQEENFSYSVVSINNGVLFYYYSDWSNTIYVDTNTGIGNAVTADGTTITATAGQINISTAEACTVSVFDMSGRTVRQLGTVEGSTSFPIEPGAYIVKCGETVRKVLVR